MGDNQFTDIVQRVKSGETPIVREAPKMIAFISKLDDTKILKECKAQAAAIAEYLANKKDAHVGEYNAAVKVKTKVEHRLGEVLGATVNHKGAAASPGPGRGHKTADTESAVSKNGTIPKELGDTKTAAQKVSSRVQQLARVPWKEIEARIDDCTRANERARPTRIAKRLMRKARMQESNGSATCTVKELKTLLRLGKKFGTIYADPPWPYGNTATRSAVGGEHGEYPTMSLQDICALPVKELASEECTLFLWTTNAFIREALIQVMEAWGFEYKSMMIWCKPQPGIGNYVRISHEILLIGTKGGWTFPEDARPTKSWLVADRREHSAKPEEFRLLIEKLSPGPRLELFGRTIEEGWTTWGNQIEKRLFDGKVSAI